VEKLAEVFRYTLERSETEWVTLAEELGVHRAYLDVEQARFAEPFRPVSKSLPNCTPQVSHYAGSDLVENAIKHGTSQARGVGRVRSRHRSSGCFRIEVRDNGPGLGPLVNGGYGLRNVTPVWSATTERERASVSSVRNPAGQEPWPGWNCPQDSHTAGG